MEIQVYYEAWLSSIFNVKYQDNETGLGLGLVFWKAVDAGYSYAYTWDPSLMLVGMYSSFSGLE